MRIIEKEARVPSEKKRQTKIIPRNAMQKKKQGSQQKKAKKSKKRGKQIKQ